MDEEQAVDLSSLDPRHGDAVIARIAQRAIELRALRRAVVRRGVVAFAIAMAAALVLWLTAPKRTIDAPQRSPDVLDWATRDIDANDVLGVSHAQ